MRQQPSGSPLWLRRPVSADPSLMQQVGRRVVAEVTGRRLVGARGSSSLPGARRRWGAAGRGARLVPGPESEQLAGFACRSACGLLGLGSYGGSGTAVVVLMDDNGARSGPD